MTPSEQRAMVAERALEVALVRKHPDLPDSAVRYLLREARGTGQWKAHIAGTEDLALGEILHAAEASEIGRLIFAADHEQEAPVDHVKAAENLSAQERIAYARRHGLA